MVPDGSIYFWMYTEGLKHRPWADVQAEVYAAGKDIRPKDEQNYWNGWYRSDLYASRASKFTQGPVAQSRPANFASKPYEEYELHPYVGQPDPSNRWVPCNADNKPLIKWGEGCMCLEEAIAWPKSKYLAENTKGCQFIVIDCDGDHGDTLDLETIQFLRPWCETTHTMDKPKMICEYEGYEGSGLTIPASFHLTYRVDRIIPTMHFPNAHIDIVGNRMNSLRYLKNKIWNGLQPELMTAEKWSSLQSYIEGREKRESL